MRAEERRQLAVLGQREQHARSAQHLAGVVAGHRDHRADADQQRAADPRNTAAASAIGVACGARSGSTPCATICASVMIGITATIVVDQRERHVAARIERLARRHRHDVEAAEDEDQQQRGGRDLVAG